MISSIIVTIAVLQLLQSASETILREISSLHRSGKKITDSCVTDAEYGGDVSQMRS